MMVETILESSQDFSMSTGALPQWKRELLQRRMARARPCLAPAPPPPPPPLPPPLPPAPAPDDDEELRYGPGIVKRLKSRYLSLALRDAPRRRPSVLRRAASLEHLLDERPPPAPAPRVPRAPRPASLAVAPPLARRDLVKRARSVDALSRLEARDEAPPAPRPPRRPQPLLRDAERPPPDVVRSTLRKFESAPPRRLALPRCSPTPEPPEPRCPTPDLPPAPARAPRVAPAPAPAPCATAPSRIGRIAKASGPTTESAPSPSPSPSPVPSADEVEGVAASSCGSRRVSRAALEEIARAGCSVRYAFGSRDEHLPPPHPPPPPLSATNPVLAARGPRRVGVIRPMPAASPSPPPPAPPPTPPAPAPAEKAAVRVASPECVPRVNGHSTPEPGALSRIGAAGIERAWSGSAVKPVPPQPAPATATATAWSRTGGARGRAPPAAATSVVFNFSNRKEVPDYIENDGIILRASRRARFKAGEAGVVALRPEALALCAGEGEGEGAGEGEGEEGPPSPCDVRFVNDNVLINGKSSMPTKHNKDRISKLKLQFDDSLTRTFEYPSETSLCEEYPPSPCPPGAEEPPADTSATLADNTHIASAALSRYTPSKTCAAAFQLGLANPRGAPPPAVNGNGSGSEGRGEKEVEGEEEGGDAEARQCGAGVAQSWSDARAHRTDLLF